MGSARRVMTRTLSYFSRKKKCSVVRSPTATEREADIEILNADDLSKKYGTGDKRFSVPRGSSLSWEIGFQAGADVHR